MRVKAWAPHAVRVRPLIIIWVFGSALARASGPAPCLTRFTERSRPGYDVTALDRTGRLENVGDGRMRRCRRIMLDRVRQCVDSYIRESGRADVDPRSAVYLDSSRGRVDGCCCLFFGADAGAALLVGKAARTDRGREIFDAEFTNLRRLDASGLNHERRSTPEPLGRWETGDVLVTLQSALPGSLMKNVPGRELFSPERAGESIAAVERWWLAFQRCFPSSRTVLSDEAYEQHVTRSIERFRATFVLGADESDFLSSRFGDERALAGAELPFMVRHSDFWTANMVLGPEGIGVFDWEAPLRHELPLFDLFLFFSSLRFPFTGTRGESSHFDSFVEVFWGESYCTREMCACLARVCDGLAVDREWLADLFALSIIETALMKHEALVESYGPRRGEAESLEPADDESKRRHWRELGERELDVPFARIEDGVSENVRYLARHGPPGFRIRG